MPITSNPGGSVMITGAGIPLYRLLAMRGAVQLEAKGIRITRGASATSIALHEFKIPGRCTAKTRAAALVAIDAAILLAREAVAAEHAQAQADEPLTMANSPYDRPYTEPGMSKTEPHGC